MSDGMKIKVTKDGPYAVYGRVPLKEETLQKDVMGRPDKWTETKKHYPDEIYMLCRCGKSTNKPFCTGDHTNFNGTETAKREAFYNNAKTYPGAEGAELIQNPSFCVGAAFCHGKNNVAQTVKSQATLNVALQQTYDCPGGSLVIKINGKEQEPKFEKGISDTVIPPKKGPIWVKGGIQVESADGYKYEVRNRVTLCSCGKSSNKPYCDGAHLR
jgi:CDGSH-type Zn-finger protein